MKKFVIMLLAAILVLSLATTAMAAQLTSNKGLEFADEKYAYMPTTWNVEGTANDKTTGIYLPDYDAPATYRIHTNYAKNTDACAACHATHTAVGSALLQWGNVYEACMACHDGTVSTTYDVQSGQIAETGNVTFGGMFGIGTEGSLSKHNVSGGIDISAAPGGTSEPNADEVNPDGTTSVNATAWTVEFGCSSCHNPHGQGGNARILNANPNSQMWEKFNSGETQGVELDAAANVKAGYAAFTIDAAVSNKFALKGYPYSAVTAVYGAGNTLVATTDYIIDNTNTVASVVYVKGAVAGPYTIWYVPALKVQMNITDYLGEAETVEHVSGLNDYCGACHTDYNTADDLATFAANKEYDKSGSHETGEYSEAYRHQVGMELADYNDADLTNLADVKKLNMPVEVGTSGSDKIMTCETCHYAHGANETLWEADQAVDNLYQNDWGVEVSGSSALKRLPNMATCEACHQKAIGAEGYASLVSSTNVEAAAAEKNVEFAIRWADTAKTTVAVDEDGYELRGSRVCKECHESDYEGWNKSLHRKKVYSGPKDEEGNWVISDKVRANWNKTQAEIGAAANYAVASGTGKPFDGMSAPGPGVIYDGVAGPNPATESLVATGDQWFIDNIQFTIGSNLKKQAYVLKYNITNWSPMGRQVGGPSGTNYVPLLWVQALNAGYGGWAWKPFTFTWETNCAGCHVTGISKMELSGNVRQSGFALRGDLNDANWQDAAFIYNENGIGCEECHGPGQDHSLNPYGDNIVNPKDLSKAAQQEACGVCHANGNGPRITSNTMSKSWDFIGGEGNFYADSVGNVTYNYLPGDSYDDGWMDPVAKGANVNNDHKNWYMAGGVDETTGLPSIFMAKVTTTPNYTNPLGASDQVDEIGFRSEYEQFMHGGNEDMKALLSCADCHDVHTASTGVIGKFGQALRRPAAQLCSQCHTSGFLQVAGEEPVVDEQFFMTEQINNIMANDVQCDSRSYGPRHTFTADVYKQRKLGQALATGDVVDLSGGAGIVVWPELNAANMAGDPVYNDVPGRTSVTMVIPIKNP